MIYRCFISPQALQMPSTTLDEVTHHHLIKVLRLKDGQTVEILNGAGDIYQGCLVITNKKSVVFESG